MDTQRKDTTKCKARPIQVGGRTVAVLRGQTLDVRRKSSGILQKPPGIAFARDLLNEAQSLGCQDITVTVTDIGAQYHITMTDFLEASWPIQRANFEPQRVAPLGAFECVTDTHSELNRTGDFVKALKSFDARQAQKPRQMSLL